jgi:hypothetical protein
MEAQRGEQRHCRGERQLVAQRAEQHAAVRVAAQLAIGGRLAVRGSHRLGASHSARLVRIDGDLLHSERRDEAEDE